MLDQDALDRVHTLQVVTCALGVACEEAVANRLELEQKLLEPELVRLVDHDEQELVVDGWVREELLEREELGELQVAAVGEEVDLDLRSFGRIDAAFPPSIAPSLAKVPARTPSQARTHILVTPRGGRRRVEDIERTDDADIASVTAERRLAAIVQSSDDAIYSVTADGLIEDWNTGAERLYGFRPRRSSGGT